MRFRFSGDIADFSLVFCDSGGIFGIDFGGLLLLPDSGCLPRRAAVIFLVLGWLTI